MEKLIYVVWKKDGSSIESFRQEILGSTARNLIDCGARALAVNLADELAVQGLRMGRLEPTGTVSIWMDTALNRGPVEELLTKVTARLVG
jgi:hypothetical protein